MRTLYAGPWVGEFGWELCGWQGTVRALARRHDRVVIGCRPSSRPMYQGMPCVVEFADIPHSMECSGSNCHPATIGQRLRRKFATAGRVTGNTFLRATNQFLDATVVLAFIAEST